jgi:hypothetical protein
MPHIFKLLKDDGITDLKLNLPEILRNRKEVEIPADAIKVEAESFTSQNNGSLIVRDNKIGADVCLVAWSLKHSITWKVKNPAGKYKVAMRYCSLGDSRINIRSGKTKFGTAHIPTTLGRGESPMDWHTVMFADKDGKEIILELPENASITMRTSSAPGPNPDYFYLIPVR